MAQIATHDGTVTEVSDGLVKVHIHVLSACSSCKAHAHCTFVDSAEKIVEVQTDDWKLYSPGQRVVVSVGESLGLQAVLLAYFLPALLLVGALLLAIRLTGSEGIAAIVTLAVIVVYFLVLYYFRDRLQRKFTFGLHPEGE